METFPVVPAVIILFFVLLLSNAIRILREYERGVVFRLGRLIGGEGIKGPGLIFLIPVIDKMVKVSLRTVVLDVPPQDIITSDNVSIKVNAVVYFRVLEPQKAIVQVEDFHSATSQISQTTLRSVLGRSELFTEHTTLAILPVLQKLASVKKLFRLWGIVFVGNITGGMIFALILSYFGKSLHFLQEWALNEIATSHLQYDWWTYLFTAIFAGWLMGLLAWLVAASRETISQIFLIIMITGAIGVIGLPHCIAGSIEVVTGMLNVVVSFSQYIGFLVPVTIGNAIGGVLFVGIMKFSHTAYSGKEKIVNLKESA